MKILAIAFSAEMKAALSDVAKADAIHWITTKDQFFNEIDGFTDGQFSAVLCEVDDEPLALEAGQALRNLLPQTPSFACAFNKEKFAPKNLKKNGFTDAFLFPIDKQNFLDAVSAALAPEALNKRAFKRILSCDLKADSTLSFTTFVHLPMNNKYLAFARKGETFSQKKIDKMRTHHVGALFIDRKDSEQFYDYMADHLKDTNGMSETERVEKLRDSVRGIFREVFDQKSETDFDAGKELMESCRKVVSAYIQPAGTKGDFHARLMRAVGGTGLDYSHSADVSTLAALFAMALGSTKVEEIAIAGFFHDIALAEFPVDYGYELNPEWSEELKKVFLNHCQAGLNLVKTKKMILPPEAEKIILQHHERFDGKGFPKALSGDRITQEAQILSLADQFHYASQPKLNHPRQRPLEILAAIGSNGSISPVLVKKASALFEPSSNPEAKSA